MIRSQYTIRENARLYALIERDPWILLTPPIPPIPPVLRAGASDPDGDPVRVAR